MSTTKTYRIGQIVPSSNTTMETEVPAMLQRAVVPERGGLHFPFESRADENGQQG